MDPQTPDIDAAELARRISAARLDTGLLAELAATIGLATLRGITATFITETPPLLAGLHAAAERADPATTNHLVHLLKGRALSLGAQALAARCATVEARAYAGELPPLDEIAGLAAAFAEAAQALRCYLATLPET